jgi:membrane-associated protein
VRTFITLVAGVGKMDRRHFFVWSAVGAVLWATGITLLGYFLGGIKLIHDNLEAAILVIVAVSVVPMLVEFLRHRSATRTAVEETAEVIEDVRDNRS